MVSSKSISNGIVRAVITLALLTLLLFFLYKIKDVIVYVLISLVISLIAAPVINFLKKRLKFSNTLAVATTLILFFTLFVGLFLLFIPLIKRTKMQLQKRFLFQKSAILRDIAQKQHSIERLIQ